MQIKNKNIPKKFHFDKNKCLHCIVTKQKLLIPNKLTSLSCNKAFTIITNEKVMDRMIDISKNKSQHKLQ